MSYSNKDLKVPLLDAIDRISILMLKMERLQNESDRLVAEKEYEFYKKVLDGYRNDDIDIKEDWISQMKAVNATLWDVEGAIREARKNNLTLEDIGHLAVQLRDKNDERNLVKNKIANEIPIDFYEIPAGDALPRDTSLMLPLHESIDRITILMLKLERLPNDKDRASIEKEHRFYEKVLAAYRRTTAFKEDWVEQLKNINGRVWDIESAIRQGREHEHGLEEMGRRTLALRELSKERVTCKKRIAEAIGSDFHEVKSDVT